MAQALAGEQATRIRLEPTERVVAAVAAAEGREPTELDPPLFDVIDPDALDTLVSEADESSGVSTISFVYRDHEVVVRWDGSVSVDGERRQGRPD